MNEKTTPMDGGKVVLYKNRIEVKLKDETVWLTQKQMVNLFQKDVRTVNEPMDNIFQEKELQKKATIRKFRIVQKEGYFLEVQREYPESFAKRESC